MGALLHGRGASEFDKLLARIRGGVSLPVPSSASMRLLEALGKADVSTRQLELVVSGDPSLAAAVLSSADFPFMMRPSREVSIRDAIIVLGTEALKAIAISASLKSLHAKTQVLAPGRFTKHSVAVAFTAKYLYARLFIRSNRPGATLTQDEVYAIGLLHDVGLLLLANQDMQAFERFDSAARRSGTSVAAAFRNFYERDLCDLAPALFDRWPHLEKLSKAIVGLGRPWDLPAEQGALICVLAADYLVTVPLEMAVEDRAIQEEPRPEVAELVEGAMAEIEIIQLAIQVHLAKCGIS